MNLTQTLNKEKPQTSYRNPGMMAPLHVSADARTTLPYAEKEVLDRLSSVDLSFVYERLLYKGEIDASDVATLDKEFKRFIFLVWATEKPIAMIGKKRDEVWHQFILFTREYEEFCNQSLGFFIDHTPDTDSVRVPDESGENFIKAYTKYFGKLPAIWTEGLPAETAAAYAEWPGHGRPPVRWASVGICARVRR